MLQAQESSKPDLLLMDLPALGESGAIDDAGLLARLRADESWRDVPIVVTVPDTGESAWFKLPPGASDCVGKPIRVPELLARIEAQLRSRSELRSARQALRQAEDELRRARDSVASNRTLVDIVHEVTGEVSATEIYRILARRVARALDITHCSVVLATSGDTAGLVTASFEDPLVSNLKISLDRYPEIVAALESNRPLLVTDARTDPLFADIRKVWSDEGRDVPIRSVITLPFVIDRWRSGVLFLRTERLERTLTQEDAEFADVVVKAAVAAMKRAQALELTQADNRRLEELATRDPLTRLLNRRALLERMAAEVDRCRRFHTKVSLLLMDVDHFKEINDSHGHLVGDDVLRQLSAVLDSAARTVDVVARYGGEEFVVILPETTQEGAVTFAERLRERIAAQAFNAGRQGLLYLTASIGVATFPAPRIDSTEDLFARADEVLYRAKSSGRNQVRT